MICSQIGISQWVDCETGKVAHPLYFYEFESWR